jgi:hypothetical protein
MTLPCVAQLDKLPQGWTYPVRPRQLRDWVGALQLGDPWRLSFLRENRDGPAIVSAVRSVYMGRPCWPTIRVYAVPVSEHASVQDLLTHVGRDVLCRWLQRVDREVTHMPDGERVCTTATRLDLFVDKARLGAAEYSRTSHKDIRWREGPKRWYSARATGAAQSLRGPGGRFSSR